MTFAPIPRSLSHLAFTGTGFLHGFLYLSDQEANLQPYLHTFPSVTSLDRYLKEILEMGCFSELKRLELDIALDSFWPSESHDPAPMFPFEAISKEPTLVTKLHLGSVLVREVIRPEVVIICARS